MNIMILIRYDSRFNYGTLTNLWTGLFCSECQALSVDFLVVMLNVDNGNWGENCEQHLHDEDSKLIWAAGAGAELNWNAQEGVNAQFLET